VTEVGFATLVLDTAAAAPGAVDETAASVRDQDGVGVELVLASGPDELRAAVSAGTGEFVGVLAPGEALVPGALAALAAAVRADTDIVYGDEVVLPGPGQGAEVRSRPVWSPERLYGHDWLGHPTLFRTALAVEACRDEQLGPAWEHDLALRVGAKARGTARVAEPLLRGPGRTPAAAEAVADTVRAHLARQGIAARVEAGSVPGTCQVHRLVPPDLSVAVVIACDGARGLAWGARRWFAVEAARSVLERAGIDNLEIVVAHQRTVDTGLLDQLLALGERVRLVTVRGPASRAELVNRGVLSSHADVVVLVDEYTEVSEDGFVAALAGPLLDDGVGLTGARLLGPHGHLRNAGYALHQHRFEPMFEDLAASEPGPDGVFTVAHEVSGLGWGALALRRTTFDAVGGLREQLDLLDAVDLSHKVRHLALRRVWVPSATAYDLAGPPRIPVRRQRQERELVRDRWHAPELDEYTPSFGAWHAARDRRLIGSG
jgi:O-antigen biosynthesis protein